MRDITLEDTVYIEFPTRAFGTGIPTTLAGSPVVSWSENGGANDSTGVTLTVDLNTVTGNNLLTIVATAANGFENNKDYNFKITTGTVGGVSVIGEVVGGFSIQRAPVNWAKVSNPTTAVDLSATDIQLVDTTTTNTDMRGTDSANTVVPDAAGVAPTAVEIRQEMDTNSVDLNTIITTLGTAGAGLTDLGGMSTAMKAEVLAESIKVLVTQMTESYAADGVAPTMTQALMLILQALTEFSISGTTQTYKQLDGTTTAATGTLNDATNPTSITRAT